MPLLALTPMLRTWYLLASIAFNVDILCFACTHASDEPAWATLQRDGIELMLSGPNAHEGDTKPAFTGSLYFRIDDAAELWAQVKDSARVCYPIEDFDYGMREFAIYDNNGYLLQFGQALSGEPVG